MKRIVLLVFATILLAVNTAKANSNFKDEPDFHFSISMREMNRQLQLDINQFEIISQTSHSLSRRIEHLEDVAAERRTELLSLFVTDNLSTVRNYLNAEQYKKYLVLLDAKLQQNGLDSVLYGKDVASLEKDK